MWKEHREGIDSMSASRSPETTAIVSVRVMSRDLSKVGCGVAPGQRLTTKSGCWKKLLQLDCGEAVIIYERLKGNHSRMQGILSAMPFCQEIPSKVTNFLSNPLILCSVESLCCCLFFYLCIRCINLLMSKWKMFVIELSAASYHWPIMCKIFSLQFGQSFVQYVAVFFLVFL